MVAALNRLSSAAAILIALAIGAVGCWLAQTYDVLTVAKYLPAFVLGSLTFEKAWTPGRGMARLSLLAFAAATLLTAFTPFLRKTGAQPFDADIYAFLLMRFFCCPTWPTRRDPAVCRDWTDNMWNLRASRSIWSMFR